MTNEKRKILYIKVNKNDYLNNFIPTNQEVLQYYNDNTNSIRWYRAKI